MKKEQLPPHDLDAEMSLLGGIILDPKKIAEVRPVINASHFYAPGNQILFSEISALHESGTAVDLVTLKNRLNESKLLEKCGGVERLLEVTEFVPGAANVAHYAKIVREKAVQRRVIADCRDLIATASNGHSFQEIMAQAQTMMATVSNDRLASPEAKYLCDEDLFDETIQSLYQKKSEGWNTGYHAIDNLFFGILPGTYWILAGRPSAGKTTLALNVMRNLLGQGARCLFVSLETTRIEIYKTLLSISSQISRTEFRRPVDQNEFVQRVKMAAQNMRSLVRNRLFLMDTAQSSAARSMDEIEAMARKIKNEHGLDFIFIDHFHLMEHPTAYTRLDQNMGLTSGRIQYLAKNTGCAVVLLAQLNREFEKEGRSRKPLLTDLRECGTLEQDADIVSFVYSDPDYKEDGYENYLTEEQASTSFTDKEKARHELKASPYKLMSVMKQKLGGLGDARLYFRYRTMTFESMR